MGVLVIRDINKLIEYVIVGYNDNIKSNNVYTDEPLLFPASRMKCYLPEKYLEMKKLAQNFDYYSDTEASLFYKQAKFMEDFEDDFEYSGTFSRSFPTYRIMNDEQLRGYFSFRTRVRNGKITKVGLSYAFVYCYELINGIGVKDAMDGYYKLLNFCQSYSELCPVMNDYYPQWINDYVIYNNLDKGLLKNVANSDFDEALGIISDSNNVSDTNLFEALDRLSSYHYYSSKAYKNAPDDMRLLTCNVFRALVDYYKNHKKGYVEKIFGKVLSGPYIMFKAAVFYDRKKYSDYEYKISSTLKYSCLRGSWYRDRLFGYRTENRELGNLFKNIDAAFRRYLGVKPEIKKIVENKLYCEIIQKELLNLEQIKKQRHFDSVKIDLKKLKGIRDAADTTRDKLIVDFEEYEHLENAIEHTQKAVNKVCESEPIKPESAVDILGLDENAIYFLNCILNGIEYTSELKKRGIMVSVLADSINDILFESFDDTVIEFDGENPVIVEDYEEELKGMLNL